MRHALSHETLRQENAAFAGTGGVSATSCGHGFLPAFRDDATGRVYLSRFADGRVAPIHLLDGLPDDVIAERTPHGAVRTVKASVTAGFVRAAHFYTRMEAAALAV